MMKKCLKINIWMMMTAKMKTLKLQEPMNEDDRLRSLLTSHDIESGYQRNSENKLRIRSDQSTLGIRALHILCLVPY